MPFPEVSRVIYRKNPLDQVVCQFQFPAILKIDKGVPDEFQEKIRGQFPNFSEKIGMNFSMNVDDSIPKELIDHVQKFNSNHEFISEDEVWKINLTRNFIALTCTDYTKWEDFKEMFMGPLGAFREIYSPQYFKRVGLRYIDVIQRSKLSLDEVEWKDLLQPYILGFNSIPDIASRVKSMSSRHEVLLSDEKSIVGIVTKFVKPLTREEICFMIDSDFFIDEHLSFEKAIEKIDFFNKQASRLIRWCITEKLHKAMEPEDYGN